MKSAVRIFYSVMIVVVTAHSALAESLTIGKVPPSRNIDVAIALDVSGSMNGLIDSARQRIWDIVNEFGAIKPAPTLRVALLTYGRDNYSSESGWVKIDQPLTTNLDSISEALFSLTTNGGTEYVARVVDTAASKLDWNKDPNGLRVIVVAGNEPATQDPLVTIEAAAKNAVKGGIVINAIHCGDSKTGIDTGWQKVAVQSDGLYASIDQNAAAVANIAAPQDAELARLNVELNTTYVVFGAGGKAQQDKQEEQDSNAMKMSAPALASRAVSKASGLYTNSHWDLVDAVKDGKKVEELSEADLPEELRGKSVDERKQFVDRQSKKRDEIQAQIGRLGKERSDYIAQERAKVAADNKSGLDTVLIKGLREQATKKGFEF